MTSVMYQQLGAVGVVLIAAGVVIFRLIRQLSEAQEARVKDAHDMMSQILELVQQHSDTNAVLATAINACTDAVRALEQRIYQR